MTPALTGFGAAPVTGATREEFAEGFNNAIGSLTPDVVDQISANNPELGSAVAGLWGAVSAVTGQDPGKPIGAQVAGVLADVITQLLTGQGILGAAMHELTGEVASSIGDAAANIPFVGFLSNIIISTVSALTAPGITPEERQRLDAKYSAYCQGFTVDIRGTGFDGAGFSDLFAQDDPRARLWRWLAGGASRDSAIRNDYEDWLRRAKPKYGITGLPIHVARQLQAVMDGIYAARRDPDAPLRTVPVTDNGAALGAVLMQVTRDQGIARAFTEDSLRSLADNFVAPGKRICTYSEEAAETTCDSYPPCRHKTSLDIGASLYDMIRRWDLKLIDPFARQRAADLAAAAPRTVIIGLDTGVANKVALGVRNAQEWGQYTRARAQGTAVKTAAFTSAVILGGGSLMLARRVAKKRRRR